jgi:hypothetical protein
MLWKGECTMNARTNPFEEYADDSFDDESWEVSPDDVPRKDKFSDDFTEDDTEFEYD